MLKCLWLLLLVPAYVSATDLSNWPVEGKITDSTVLTELANDSRVDISQCPQLQALRASIVPGSAPHEIVAFCIQNESKGRPWNTQDLKLTRGQILRILNFDESAHRLHATTGPCPHEPGEMAPVKLDASGKVSELSYFNCKIGVETMEPLDRYFRARNYDHYDGPDVAPFYIRVGEQEFYPGASYDYILDQVPLDRELTLARLMNAIAVYKLNTIESVAAFLPSEMKHWNYVMMFKSRSLQEASPTAPRAIAYTPTARFITTFNGGDPNAYGSDTIEMIQFNDQNYRFDFYELQFREGSAPVLSSANPPKCLGCHQSVTRSTADLRPNWEPYDVWPGAFGFHSLTEGQFHDQQEEENYNSYLRVAFTHPRYRTFHRGPSLKAPTRLTQSLGELNFLRVSRLILEQTAIYEKNKVLIWYFFNCWTNDKELLEGPLKAPFERLLASGSLYAQPYYNHVTTSFFLALIFESEGIDTSDWSMDFRSLGKFSSIPNERFAMPGFVKKEFFGAYKYLLARQQPEDLAQLQPLSCSELHSQVIGKKVDDRPPRSIARTSL